MTTGSSLEKNITGDAIDDCGPGSVSAFKIKRSGDSDQAAASVLWGPSFYSVENV